MAFLTLFPNGVALQMHKYIVHLLKFHDQRFGRHPRFCYFVLNLMMRNRNQNLASIFIKQNAEENIATNMSDLRAHMNTFPDNQLAKELMHYRVTMRGTRPYWNTRCKELSNMIHQLGPPTLFFTLSVVDTKWPDLQKILSSDNGMHQQSG